MDRRIDGHMAEEEKDRWTDEQMDGRRDRQVDKSTDIHKADVEKYRCTEVPMDRRIERQKN